MNSGKNAGAQTAAYYQLNFIYDTDTTLLSDWGAIDITFMGSTGYKFLNLKVDTVWAIENMPVVSVEGILSQTQRFWFPLSDSDTVFTSLIVGMTFTDTLLTVAPSLTDTVSVSQFTYKIFTGSTSGATTGGKKKPSDKEKQKGGAPTAPAPAAPSHAGFPNQSADPNECVPAAISNSLNYLNAKHSMGMPAGAISIDSLKQPLNWTPSAGVDRTSWADRKNKYMQKRKLPIKTGDGGPAHLGQIPKLLADGQDVEIDAVFKGDPTKAHAMSIVNVTPLPGGNFSITDRHDADQAGPGGLVDETGTFDTGEGEFDKGPLGQFGGFFLIVECPAKSKPQPTPKQPKKNGTIKSTHGVSSGGGGGGIPANANSNQLQLQNMVLHTFSDSIPMPPLGFTDTVSFTCFAVFQLSLDTGVTFSNVTANATCALLIRHTDDIGPTSFFETEMLQMDLVGGSLPAGLMFRENPADSSLGLIIQTPSGGMYDEVNFVRIKPQVSFTGGASWLSFDNVLMLEADNTPPPAALIPTMTEWGIILLSLLMITVAVFVLKGRLFGNG